MRDIESPKLEPTFIEFMAIVSYGSNCFYQHAKEWMKEKRQEVAQRVKFFVYES